MVVQYVYYHSLHVFVFSKVLEGPRWTLFSSNYNGLRIYNLWTLL